MRSLIRICSTLALCAAAGIGAAQERAADDALARLFVGMTLYTSELPDRDRYSRDDLWRFTADGRMTASYTLMIGSPDGASPMNFSDEGDWRVAGGTLCLRWQELWAGKERCFQIAPTGGRKYGPNMYQATDTASGQVWKFALAR
ncbi:MAG: hypothetical protein QNJ94_09445 [Alphaproteobacteria bacterium]|nr:hypothetical protein [Alphaproteobacteria bacterium]